MKKIVGNLDDYNFRACINKLRDLSNERSILNRQLDELIVEYRGLEEINLEIEYKLV